VGIAGEHLGREEFLEKFWKGELFFDMDKKTWFPAVHGGKKKTNTAGGVLSLLTGGVVSKAWKRSQGKNIEGNLKGEGYTLGGVWVVHPTEVGTCMDASGVFVRLKTTHADAHKCVHMHVYVCMLTCTHGQTRTARQGARTCPGRLAHGIRK